MKRVSSRPSSLIPYVAAFAALTSVGCSAGDDGDGDDDIQSFNPLGAAGAAAGASSTGAGGQVSTPVGSAGSGGTGAVSGGSNEGVGGSLPLGSGGSGTGTGVGAGTGGSGDAPAAGGTGAGGAGVGGSAPAGTAGAGTGGSVAAGGSGGTGAVSAGPGRVGAELCPPGPFGNPLGGGVTVGTPVASVNGAGFLIFEGPVWTGTELFFSEIGNGNVSQINRFTPNGGFERGVFTNTGSNGIAIDPNGDLLLAAHDVGGISSLDLPGGAITRGAQQRNGQRFNSPNDLVLRGDGNIYFTDPDFQSPSGRIQGGTNVYRIAPDGTVSVVDDSMDNPNGVTLSPDGNTLYASANGFLREYSLDAAGAPTPLGDLATGFGQPDGMAMDCAGNIYAVQNGAQTITVFTPEGDILGTIGPAGFAGQGVTNAAFGGQNRTTLFITTFTGNGQGGLFAVELGVPGLPY
jgi:gluconolactonase